MTPANVRRFAGVASAFAIVAMPVAANAAGQLWICRKTDGYVEYVTIDLAARHVTMMSGRSPNRCKVDIQDGASAYPLSAPPGEYCAEDLVLEHEAARQFVRSNGHTVIFGLVVNGNTTTLKFDLENGIFDTGQDIEECHRPHG